MRHPYNSRLFKLIMKKLQLKLEGKEQLSKEQMKNIRGGYAYCSADCGNGLHVYCYAWLGVCHANGYGGCYAVSGEDGSSYTEVCPSF